MIVIKSIFVALVAAVAVAAVVAQTQPAAFPVGHGPEGVVTDGASVFVANQFSNTVTKLHAGDGAVVGTYTVGHRPVALAFDGAFFWVANYLSNNVMKLDPRVARSSARTRSATDQADCS